jgi:elongation factor G
MKQFESKDIRNIAIVGHGGCGKTSLGEALLFSAGATTRLGRTDDGSTVLDWEPEELTRQSSVSTGLASCEWKRRKINIFDTPGDANFSNDARNCMSVADAVLLVVSAVDGVEVQTEGMWELATELNVPRAIFINKLDRERSDPEAALKEIKEVLHAGVVPLQMPIGKESTFEGVIDLLSGKAYRYSGDGSGMATEGEVPAELADAAAAARRALVEGVAETDEALMEKYFEEDDLPQADLVEHLPRLIQTGVLVPVLYGAAARNSGTDRLLNLIVDGFPSPLARGSVTARSGQGDETVELDLSSDGALAAQVFKTVADAYAGQLTIFRVWSGTVSSDGNLLNTTRRAKERIGPILSIQGKKQEHMGSASAGDIAAVAKLKETKTGDTLTDLGGKVVFAPIEAMAPSISFAIKPTSKGDEDKLIPSLHRLAEEDPSLQITLDEQSRDIILSGLGQVHVEVVLARLKRKFGVEVALSLPKVPYREAIRRKVTGIEGKHKKQTGGRGQFGVCYIDLEPLTRGEQYEFVNDIFGGAIPRQYIPAVDKGIRESMVRGPQAGYPVVDIKARLYDGKYHNVDSSEMAFKIAGSLAFKEGFMRAGPCLLEPIMNMIIVVPDDNMGDVMGDVTSRRGKVSGMDSRGRYQVIKATVPMSEVLQYAPDLRSMTSGRGSFTMELSHYEELPSHLTEKVVADAAKAKEEGE